MSSEIVAPQVATIRLSSTGKHAISTISVRVLVLVLVVVPARVSVPYVSLPSYTSTVIPLAVSRAGYNDANG
jgi:hypothetical protein